MFAWKIITIISAILLSSLPLTLAAQDISDNKGLVLSGRLINDNFINQYYDTNSNQTTLNYSGKTTIRLGAVNADHSQAKIQANLDIILLNGELADSYNKLLMNTNQLLSLPGNNLTIMLTLRQLYLAIYPSFADISIGRQIINFGVGTFFSPINVFSTFDPADIDFTKTGSDTARVKIPFGDLGGLDLISTFTTKMTNSTQALKLFGNLNGFDFSGVGIYHGASREITAGATFKGDIEIGIHGEAVEHYFIDGNTNYFEGMLGTDYSFLDSKLAFFLEYYYNGLPIDPSKINFLNILSINRMFYNKHYLFLEGLYSIDEIRTAGAFIIYNPLDNAFETSVNYTQDIFQNAKLTGYIQYFKNNLNGLTFIKSPDLIYALRLEVLF